MKLRQAGGTGLTSSFTAFIGWFTVRYEKRYAPFFQAERDRSESGRVSVDLNGDFAV